MPKRGKQTKKARDEAMLAGIRKHKAVFDLPRRTEGSFDLDAFVTMLEEHLATLADIALHTALRSEAITREKQQEAALLPMWVRVANFARSAVGEADPAMLDFGVKPYVKPVLSLETKVLAVAKRRATRAKRRTMGKKQRKKIRG